MIAMALACEPRILIADEPTTALDVTIQAGILDLMREVRERLGTAILLITHNLGVVADIADRVVVMYAGRQVEQAPVQELFAHPQHPYTIGLLGAVPRPGGADRSMRLREIPGRVPQLAVLPQACAFAPRCPRADELSWTQVPELREVRPSHVVACFRPGEEPAAERRLRRSRSRTSSSTFRWAAGCSRAGGAGPRRRGRLVLARPGRAAWVWSASRGAASRPSRNCVVRLTEPTGGTIKLQGTDITHLSRRAMRPYRRQLHMVFQDPYSSLNPRMTTGQIVGEPIRMHRLARGSALDGRVADLFDRCGLRPELRHRYPHELSGGQRQRVGLARALSVEPQVLVADEPVSALDVSVQASILNLLRDLQRDLGFSCLFITHDLSTVEFLCDRVAVMYLGRIVELASREDLFARPQHPYTQALLSAAVVPDPEVQRRRQRIVLEGDIPSPISPPSGCAFRTRCPYAERSAPRSVDEVPQLRKVGDGHYVACHLEDVA